MRRFWLMLVCIIMAIGSAAFFSLQVQAASLQDSPYVTFSPDGKAFTTNAGDREYTWYEEGTTVSTGVASSIRALQKGEHYYKVRRDGEIAVGTWKVIHKGSSCCHNSYPPAGVLYHGLEFGRNCCLQPYNSGWVATCADCGETITSILIYMSRSAAESIKVLDISLDYYYLCPFCSNLEQGTGFGIHYCKDISWNRYQVRYNSNAADWVGGYMENSFHMYNNERSYEGNEVTPQTRLNKNTYTRIGYEFSGWNTKPDGSGIWFADQEEILNLSEENYDESGKGTVTVYAQWKKSESKLKIDPAGGSYRGQKEITEVTGTFGDSYELAGSELTPPTGFQISFETDGGKYIAPITGSMSLKEWIPQQPLQGKFQDDIYYFLGTSGSVDLVKADYSYDAVTLPDAEKEGSSFGGWYYDPECLSPAGNPGDQLIPQDNITLYAKWVDLVLDAKDNYSANQGRGAVDLSWQQNDGRDKTYMIYQSEDNVHWTLLSDAGDVSSSTKVERTFGYSGTVKTYRFPYTGLYTLTLTGAQGGNYGSFRGGYGGSVSGKVWLEKGEILTYEIGGSNGYHGGGNGDTFANGGGCTTVSSNLKGLLFTAGGGGGASSLANGGAGGLQAGNLSTGINGENGPAGGGGGYRGGQAGEVTYHYHSEQCFITQETSYTLMSNSDYVSQWAQEFGNRNTVYGVGGGNYAFRKDIWGVYFHGKDRNSVYLGLGEYYDDRGKLQYQWIPTNGNDVLNIHMSADSWGEGVLEDGALTVWNQKNEIIFSKSLASVTRYRDLDNGDSESIDRFFRAFELRTGGCKGTSSGWYSFYADIPNCYVDYSKVYWNEKVSLPEGTTAVRIALWSQFTDNAAWIQSCIHEISFTGTQTVQICPYEKDGQLISAKSAYGGSSYVNTDYVGSYLQEAGKQAGNGTLTIQSVKTGYMDTLFLNGVTATDHASPDKVEKATVVKTAVDETTLRLEWEKPKDNGTPYYHKAESYLPESTDVLSESNVTVNVLTCGVSGFYYIVDQDPDTVVKAEAAVFSKEPEAEVELTQDQQFFHVAAVDKAGNLSETIHIEIGRKDEEVAWPVRTEQMEVSSSGDSVYESSPGVFYVKCDGTTPFSLQFDSILVGEASLQYQINHSMFYVKEQSGEYIVMDIQTPLSERVVDTVITMNAAELVKHFTGKLALTDDSYTVTRRSNRCKQLHIEQRFTMSTAMNGRRIQVVPVAGADFREELILSDWNRDLTNGVFLIGDNVAPAILGIEELERCLEQIPLEEDKCVTLLAKDEGSGLQDFYVVITNLDSGNRRKYTKSGDSITIEILQTDALFRGDLTVEFYAVDHVGNENISSSSREGFAVTAAAQRILAPHEPVFRCGESGKVTVAAYGYVDKVEIVFPKELMDLAPELHAVFEYEGTAYSQLEEYEFMIPLGTPLGEYKIAVNAWKDGEIKTSMPLIWTLGEEESVLNDIRTRLR